MLIGKINYGCIIGNGIMEGSWFLLSRVINPKFTQDTEKNPDEHGSELSQCWTRFVPGASRIQATRTSSWPKWIKYLRDIHGMCTNMNLYMWMIDGYDVVAALQILLRAFLFDSLPLHRLFWLMFLVNVLSSFWRMKGQYFSQVTTASTQSLSVYHTPNIVLLDAISFTILTASLIDL
jgi:hypothetical protein